MATGLDTKLTGQIGEHLVVTELGRRGIIATPFAGNVPDIDILACANGKTAQIQVKAVNSVSWQFDVRRFLEVELTTSGQHVNGKNKNLDRRIICVFLSLGEILGANNFMFSDKVSYRTFSSKPGKDEILLKTSILTMVLFGKNK